MLWFLFGTAFAVQLAYWGLFARGFRHACRAVPAPADARPPLSVVVAAREEEAALPALLAALTGQTHPGYEVIVVDDASTDATPLLVRAAAARHAHVRLEQVRDPQPPRKRRALTQGIRAARHDLLALTDADCAPPPAWLETLARYHAAAGPDALFIGYSPFRRRPGLLNRLARYETFIAGFFTAAAAGLGRPYMAVGRNLSYPRAVFDRVGGFAHAPRSLSGDDDLLVQAVARRRAATVYALCDPRTFVPTDAPATWRQWIRQKRRHTSAGRFYTPSLQVHLGLYHATSLLLWAAPLAGWLGAALLGGRLLAQHLVLRPAARTLAEADLMPAQPFLELLYAAYNLLIAPLGLLKMPARW